MQSKADSAVETPNVSAFETSAHGWPRRASRRSPFHSTMVMLALAGLAAVGTASGVLAQAPETPPGIPVEGFKQLIPRGGIPAIVDPIFVDAADAEMPDDAWVLGYAVGNEAYAYDLNVLNSHEIVNHEVAGTPIAAVW